MSSRASLYAMGSTLETVFEGSRSDPHLPSLTSGTSYGETSSSTHTLHLGTDSSTGWRGKATLPHDPSFEVDQVGDIRAVDSGWLDDDVEEVMVVKKKKRKPLSVIIEATEGIPRSPSKPKTDAAVDASNFEYIRTLQVGEFGESLVARKTDTCKVHTVKLVRKSGYNSAGLAARIASEQKILRVLTECRVPFAVNLFWSFEDERAMYMVIDRTDGRNLRNVVQIQGPLPAEEATLCAAELVEGIFGLHALGIVHAALKPESILIGEDGHILISDFDDAAFLHDDLERDFGPRSTRSPNSTAYQAPEIILGWEHDYAVDWWSFGLMLFWTVTGNVRSFVRLAVLASHIAWQWQHPFVDVREAEHPSIVQGKILHATLTDDRLGMEEEVYQLIARCLQRNPALRIDGLGVRMHACFHGISWEDIATKQTEAPFARHENPALQDLDDAEESENQPVAHDDTTALALTLAPDSFAFDWQHVSSPVGASVSTASESPGFRGHLQALRNDYGLSDMTVKPQDFARSSPKLDNPAVSNCLEENKENENTSGEFGTLPAGVSGSSAKIGNLRRYSSLNFDLQSSASGMSLGAPAEDLTGEPVPSPVQLRHARSFLGLSLGSADDSLNAPSWTNKLRRRTRADTPPLAVAAAPKELPKGIRQMGNGIGYTRRGESRRSVLTLASLTPRTCQAMFSGRLPRFGGKRKQKEAEVPEGGGAQNGGVDVAEDEEDPMDEVMREIYGDDWAGGASPGDAPARGGISGGGGERVGLGWEDAMPTARYGTPPVDASFAGADSTLRLVSPSTPQLGLY